MDAEERYTSFGTPLKVYYRPEDIAHIEYERDLCDLGEYPFTRGLYPTGYRGYSWVQRDICGFDLPEDTNKRIKLLLKMGQQSFRGQLAANIAFDLPTQLGLDSDHPLVRSEVGKVGCVCNTVGDMERLLEGIPLDNFNVAFNLNSFAPANLAMYIVYGESQGIPRKKLRGQNPNNPLCYFNGCQIIFPPEKHFRLMIDLMKFCSREMPLWTTINLAGYHVSEGGGTPPQEVAFIITQAIEVVKGGINVGLEVDEFAPRLSSFVGLNNEFFENIAKVRALRRMYAHLMKERFGAKNKRSWTLRIMSWTSGASATAQQCLNNISRAAIQALSGVLAGVQMIHTVSYDEALSVPTEEAVRVAMLTQKIIEHETGTCHVADPLGGSYFIESLTDEIEREAWKYVEEVEKRGGHLACFKDGYLEKVVLKERLKKQKEMEEGKRLIVGVNCYALEEEPPIPIHAHRPNVADIAIERLKEWRKNRDQGRVEEALARLSEAASKEGEELMPHFIEAARAKATIGEMRSAVQKVWGEYRQPPVLAV